MSEIPSLTDDDIDTVETEFRAPPDLEEIVTPPLPTPADRPPDLADRLLDAQTVQHRERMEEARELRRTIGTRLTSIETGQSDLGKQLARIEAGGLGTWERRGMLTGGLVVLLLLILLLAESRGVDTTRAVQGVRELAPLASSTSPASTPATSPVAVEVAASPLPGDASP